MGLLSMRS
jgi:hypothetical protein